MGNYSYCVIVRELIAVSVQLRILALSATPGTNRKTIQQIIDNLCISTLEYREESDDDVSKFVHNRKIELIQVAMGQDAVDCDNMLVELISPYAKRLRSLGLLHSRDITNISPPELLSMRDKFRQAPPDISHPKNAVDVEGYFGLLITLCHIRKLLSSHGVKPAYEMLEDKLQQWSLKRYMSRNEVMQKLKLLMQKSLSNGAFTPKLSKMLEVLADHFSTKDPKCSRVIIFSNFRGSVREIMDSLVNIGEHVKATEFIGQSSGKSLKGQSQKVQQAVLEKFRAGGYNVIVATSIGEEGLDIMEVDLVICFDANISSLRMIQRMGRTGRKNDGRVVVLACEGSELKGYFKKQANGKVVKKHMQNGGLQSFTFYPSPRMVPHVFKPEAHFVKLSIEEYVPRTKKLTDRHSFQTSNVAEKLTDSEAHLLAKYFKPNADNTWKPSLIAFPHFQAYPSRIHRVMHSLRTRILIDAVQSLQENSPFAAKIFIEDQAVSSPCLKEAHVCNIEGGSLCSNNSLKEDFEAGVSDSNLLAASTIYANDMHKISKSQGQRSVDHCRLFSSKFVSVDSQGKVQILLVPIIPNKQTSTCRSSEAGKMLPANFLDQSPGTPKLKNEFPDEAEGAEETLRQVPSYNVKDTELSPRLTQFIRSGVVPESPMDGHGLLSLEEYFESPKITSQSAKKRLIIETTITVREASDSPVEEASTHLIEEIYCNGKHASPVAEETHIISANMEPQSCSKDWCSTSGNKIASGEKPRELKRLRRHGDICRRSNRNNVKENSNIHKRNLITPSTGPSLITAIHSRDEQEPDFNVRDFIEEEPEVSSGAIVSDDEELQEESSSYESSFIDDRVNLTSPGTQAEVGSIDMMGIYRRSLLSQSPIVTSISPQPAAPRNRTGSNGSFLDKPSSSSRTLEAESGNTRYAGNSVSYPHRWCSNTTTSGARPLSVTLSSEESNGVENQKRKVNCIELGSVPAVNLEERFMALSEADHIELAANDHAEKVDVNGSILGKQSSIAGQSVNTGMNGEMCDDDDSFYASLDLDAVEAQAAMLLKNKSQVSVQREELICKTIPRYDLIDSPSFDLGI